jgi:hypothetical protein
MNGHWQVGARLRLVIGLSIVAAGCAAALGILATRMIGAPIRPGMMLAVMLGSGAIVLLGGALAALLRGTGAPRRPGRSPYHRQA